MIVGGSRSFANPATQALLPNIVPKAYFPTAVTFNASAWQSSSIMGPAVGGFLYVLGPSVVFGMSTFCFAAASLLISTVTAPAQAEGAKRERPTLDTLFAGVRFIRSRPVILGAISLDLFAVLLGGAIALLPIYARDILHTGPWGLGLLRTTPAVGAIWSRCCWPGIPIRNRAGLHMFAAVAVFGAATIVFGLSTVARRCRSSRSRRRRRRHGERGGAADVGAAGDPGRDARAGRGGELGVHRRVERARRVRIGRGGRLDRPVGAVVLGGIGTLVVAGLWIRLFPALWKRDTLT